MTAVNNQQHQQMILKPAYAVRATQAVWLHDMLPPNRTQQNKHFAELIRGNPRQRLKLVLAKEPCAVKICHVEGASIPLQH